MPSTYTPSLRGFAPKLSLRQPFSRMFLAIDRPLAVWQKRREYREQLRQMPEYLLRDIGLSVAEAQDEARKPFWHA